MKDSGSFGVKKETEKFCRGLKIDLEILKKQKGGKGVGRENLSWKITITVLISEKRKPRLEA